MRRLAVGLLALALLVLVHADDPIRGVTLALSEPFTGRVVDMTVTIERFTNPVNTTDEIHVSLPPQFRFDNFLSCQLLHPSAFVFLDASPLYTPTYSTVVMTLTSGSIPNTEEQTVITCNGVVNSRSLLRQEELYGKITALNRSGTTNLQSAVVAVPLIERSTLGTTTHTITTQNNRAGSGPTTIAVNIFPLSNSLIPGDYIQFALPSVWSVYTNAACLLYQDNQSRTAFSSVQGNTIRVFPQENVRSDQLITLNCSGVSTPLLEASSRSDVQVITLSSNNRQIDYSDTFEIETILPPSDNIGGISSSVITTPNSTGTVATITIDVNPLPHTDSNMAIRVTFDDDTYTYRGDTECTILHYNYTSYEDKATSSPITYHPYLSLSNSTSILLHINTSSGSDKLYPLNTVTRIVCHNITTPRTEVLSIPLTITTYTTTTDPINPQIITQLDTSSPSVLSPASHRNVLSPSSPITVTVQYPRVHGPLGWMRIPLYTRSGVWMTGDSITVLLPEGWIATQGTTTCALTSGDPVDPTPSPLHAELNLLSTTTNNNYNNNEQISSLRNSMSMKTKRKHLTSGISLLSLTTYSTTTTVTSRPSGTSSVSGGIADVAGLTIQVMITEPSTTILPSVENVTLICNQVGNPWVVTPANPGLVIRVLDAHERVIEETRSALLPYVRPLTNPIGETLSVVTPSSPYAGTTGTMLITISPFTSPVPTLGHLTITFTPPFAVTTTGSTPTFCTVLHDVATLEGTTTILDPHTLKYTITTGSITSENVTTYITCTDIKSPRVETPPVLFNVSSWHSDGTYLDATEKLYSPLIQRAPLGGDVAEMAVADPRAGSETEMTMTIRPLSTSTVERDSVCVSMPQGWRARNTTTCSLYLGDTQLSINTTAITQYANLSYIREPPTGIHGDNGTAIVCGTLLEGATIPSNYYQSVKLVCTQVLVPSTTSPASYSGSALTIDPSLSPMDGTSQLYVPRVTPPTDPVDRPYVSQLLSIVTPSVLTYDQSQSLQLAYMRVLSASTLLSTNILRQYASPDGSTIVVTVALYPKQGYTSSQLSTHLSLVQQDVVSQIRGLLEVNTVTVMTPTLEVMPGACSNGVHDEGETDVDCGGNKCAQCGADKKCIVHTDCSSFSCLVMKCRGGYAGLTSSSTTSIPSFISLAFIGLAVIGATIAGV